MPRDKEQRLGTLADVIAMSKERTKEDVEIAFLKRFVQVVREGMEL